MSVEAGDRPVAGVPGGDERYRQLFEEAGVGLSVGTAEGIVLHVNRSYAAFLGRTPAELEGRHIREIIEVEHLPQTIHVLREPWTPGSEELTATLKLRRRVIESKYAAEIDALYATEMR